MARRLHTAISRPSRAAGACADTYVDVSDREGGGSTWKITVSPTGRVYVSQSATEPGEAFEKADPRRRAHASAAREAALVHLAALYARILLERAA